MRSTKTVTLAMQRQTRARGAALRQDQAAAAAKRRADLGRALVVVTTISLIAANALWFVG